MARRSRLLEQPRAIRQTQIYLGSAIGILGASILVGTYLWMSSRTFVALNVPVSLARGNITTRPFKINLNNYYTVEIDTGWESYFDPNCPSFSNVRARWMLYKDGVVVVNWVETSSPYTYLSGFESGPGMYELHLEVLSDSACLNPGHPRLRVYTDRGEYEDRAALALWTSAIGVPLGLSLVILALPPAGLESRNLGISDSQSIGQCFQWAQRLPLRPQFKLPPAFALVAAPVLVILVFVFMVLLQHYPSRGLYVHLLRPGHSAGEDDFPAGRLSHASPTRVPQLLKFT